MRHFYPDDDALAAAQQDGPEWNSKREQLQLLLSEPNHLLNETYMKKLGIGERKTKSYHIWRWWATCYVMCHYQDSSISQMEQPN